MKLQSGSFVYSKVPLGETSRPDIYIYIYIQNFISWYEKTSILLSWALTRKKNFFLLTHFSINKAKPIQLQRKHKKQYNKRRNRGTCETHTHTHTHIYNIMKKLSMRFIKKIKTNLAMTKSSLTILEPSPIYFWTNSEPETLMKVQSVWWATALANSVFPVPGGPYSRTPYRVERERVGENHKLQCLLSKEINLQVNVATSCYLWLSYSKTLK